MVWLDGNRSAGGERIGFWPDTLNNLAWSKDNIIAVGGSETTSLLIPRLKVSGSRRWDRINIRTNFFTQEEVASQLPLSWKNFSIGEEMSEAGVHSLDWSPPGVGKHRRCVLAVLTSNHVLSIWECVGRPEIGSDWVRACVVNHALEAHLKEQHHSDPESQQERLERIKSHQRIRAFAWSHAPQSSPMTGASGACATDLPYLAVSNDRGEVFLLKVESPHADILTPQKPSWSFSVAQSFTVEVPRARRSPLASCMPISLRWKNAFVDQLAWSPWSTDSSGALTSVLAFTSQSSLQCKLIRLIDEDDCTSVDAGYSIQLLPGERNVQPAGPMRWAPKLKDGKDAFLVYPCRNTLYSLQVPPGFGTGFQVTTRNIDITWDEISGLSFTQDDHETFILQLAYHIGSGNDCVTEMSLPFTSESSSNASSWRQALLDEEAKFSDTNGLNSRAFTRTHGLCVSPLGDMLAINISHHPSDEVEYTINSDQVSSIVMSPVRESQGDEPFALSGSPSHPYEISSEVLLFALQSVMSQQSHSTLDAQLLLAQVLQILDLANVPVAQHNQSLITEDASPQAIVRQVRHNILFHQDTIASRSRQLLNLVNGDTPKTPPLDVTVVRRIVTEVAKLPHFIADSSPLSHTILQIHCSILVKLDARAGGNEVDADDEVLEKCDICSSSIHFESLRWARCVNNHQFSRCALSFLAIQAPGTAKACHICNAQYLNEHMMPELTQANGVDFGSGPDKDGLTQGTSSQEPQLSLARILFAACDRCVCCGGKFVG